MSTRPGSTASAALEVFADPEPMLLLRSCRWHPTPKADRPAPTTRRNPIRSARHHHPMRLRTPNPMRRGTTLERCWATSERLRSRCRHHRGCQEPPPPRAAPCPQRPCGAVSSPLAVAPKPYRSPLLGPERPGPNAYDPGASGPNDAAARYWSSGASLVGLTDASLVGLTDRVAGRINRRVAGRIDRRVAGRIDPPRRLSLVRSIPLLLRWASSVRRSRSWCLPSRGCPRSQRVKTPAIRTHAAAGMSWVRFSKREAGPRTARLPGWANS